MSLALSPSLYIFPERLLAMLLWGVVCGGGLGLCWDAFRLTRVALGIRYRVRGVDALYERPLPLLRRPLRKPEPKSGRALSVLQAVVIFWEDVLFGLLFGVVLTLLTYATADGIPRIMAPVGILVGFWFYYVTVGRMVLSLSEGILFVLRAALAYAVALLLLPLRLWQRTVGAAIGRAMAQWRARRAELYHKRMLQRLTALAEAGWLADVKKKGGWQYAKQKKGQKDDPGIAEYADLSDADRRLCHHLFCHQADATKQAETRGRRPARADRRGAAKGIRPSA